MSLRGRLLVASLALLVCGLAAADVVTYVALRSFLVNQLDARLDEAGESLESNDQGPGRGRDRAQSSDLEQVLIAAPGVYVQKRDPTGRVLVQTTGAGTGEAQAEPALPNPLPAPGEASNTTDHDDQGQTSVRLTVPAATDGAGFRMRVSSSPDGDTIIVALPLDPVYDTLHGLLAIEAIVSFVIVLLAALIGSWLVRVGLRPLDDISDTAAHIAAGDLSRRVTLDDDRTEVGRLGGSLNVMLGQIESAFAERQRSEEALRASESRLRRFVADASHELRTPTAAIQAYAELFDRGADQHPEDLPRVMRNIRKESIRMGVLVDDLLLLTRLDQGRPLEQRPVDLGAIAADAVDAALALDPDRPIGLHVDGLVEVRGDRMRLRQIADNLLLNVRLHTPPGSAVEVDVRQDDGVATFRVIDHGPGLGDDESVLVFERFYRADPSRSRADGGSGLGLSIVAAIATAHGGRASVHPTPGGGATFEIALPSLDGLERPEYHVPQPPSRAPQGAGPDPAVGVATSATQLSE